MYTQIRALASDAQSQIRIPSHPSQVLLRQACCPDPQLPHSYCSRWQLGGRPAAAAAAPSVLQAGQLTDAVAVQARVVAPPQQQRQGLSWGPPRAYPVRQALHSAVQW